MPALVRTQQQPRPHGTPSSFTVTRGGHVFTCHAGVGGMREVVVYRAGSQDAVTSITADERVRCARQVAAIGNEWLRRTRGRARR